MGIFGPWNATFSHYDGHTDSSNWGTLVSTGTSKMQTWINQHSSQCVANNIDITTPLTAARLQPYDVILILDLFHTQADLQAYFNTKLTTSNVTYTGSQRTLGASEVTVFQQWYALGGKGFMTTIGVENGPTEAENVNMLLAPFGIQYDTVNNNITPAQITISGSEFLSTCPIAKPITNSVGSLWIRHGTNINVSGLQESSTSSAYASTNLWTVGVARILNNARVNVWGDEWITYDDVWTNYDAGPYWENVLNWLSPWCGASSGCP